ncbi:MAG: zeta toxin family protein [Candidatus Saccharimonadales bacterium]
MELSAEERIESQKAVDWIKSNINDIFLDMVRDVDYASVSLPVALFMAGTPGAGKTEISKLLLQNFEKQPLRIDADDFRCKIPGYDGTNAYVFQNAATIAVQKVLDRAFAKNIPFVLDGTFGYANSLMNIKRAIRHNYKPEIVFVYQEPEQAWYFTKIREKAEGRVVPATVFIEAYLKSKQNVRSVKDEFGDAVEVTLVIKNINADDEKVIADIREIEPYLEKSYNEDELKGLLS